MVGVDKLFAPLLGKPVLFYSLRALHESRLVHDIVLVLSPGNLDRGQSMVDANGWHKVRKVRQGGERRQDSVRLGLEELPDSEWIVVHDGARPFLEEGLLSRGLAEARATGSAVAAVPLKDTIKSADDDMTVTDTIPRDRLWAVQTPQVFRREALAEAHERVTDTVTDDAAMVERAGGKVRLFMGTYTNLKITTQEDLPIAEAILRSGA